MILFYNIVMYKIKITEEMRKCAKEESLKRNPHIKHHFEVSHYSKSHRDQIGFLGEFAACELLGKDWKNNIREDYLTIDAQDLKCGDLKFDFKTESIPSIFIQKVISKGVKDDELYGRRLVCEGQKKLLEKYDILIFGAVERGVEDYWYFLGWIYAKYILENYHPIKQKPSGGEYPIPGFPVKNSDLKTFEELCSLSDFSKLH
jgi:hypothetical protein